MKRPLIILAGIAVLLAGLAYRLPAYLRYTTPPLEAGAVVLFLGAKTEARGQQAVDLVNAGLGRHLIVPINQAFIPVTPPLTAFTPASTYHRPAQEAQKRRFPFFVEGTHVEMLAAKDLMDAAGLRSANLVSSPYHMRRLKIIAERVFGPDYDLAFVPTVYETPDEGFWPASPWDRNWVFPEAVKILWFWLYEPVYWMFAAGESR
jgi:uncharacterized SAM-binding protein YcdF (DUF218 family)